MSKSRTANQVEVLSARDSITKTPFYIAGNSSDGSIYVDVNSITNALVTTPLVGQSKIAITGTAVQLSNQILANGVIISAPSGNAASVTIGGSGVTRTADGTGNGYILAAGASVSFAVSNVNNLYINGTAGDFVSWAGS